MPGRKKAPKDKNAPKRASSAYFIFSNKRRPILQKENPNCKITDVSKLISAEWKKMTDEDKKIYEEQAKVEKARYSKEIQEYKKSDSYKKHQQELKEWKDNEKDTITFKKTKAPKKPEGMPKSALSAYLIFSNERRPQLHEEYPDKKLTDLTKIISKEWRELDSDKKREYTKIAALKKEEYQKEFGKFKQTDEYKEYELACKEHKKSNKIKKIKKPKMENAPKKNMSSFFLFSTERRPVLTKERSDLKLTQISKLISTEWKNMDESRKKEYESKAKILKVKYEQDMQEYKKTKDYKDYLEKLAEYNKAVKEEKNETKVKKTKSKRNGKKEMVEESSGEEDSGSESSSGSEESSSTESSD